jgi:hypothetical protein
MRLNEETGDWEIGVEWGAGDGVFERMVERICDLGMKMSQTWIDHDPFLCLCSDGQILQ